jgi:hypothetical protein
MKTTAAQPEILPPGAGPHEEAVHPRLGGAGGAFRDENLDMLSRVLDTWFRIPGTNIRFGLDGIIGFVPGIGDVLAGLASCVIVLAAFFRGAPMITIARMVANLAIEVVIGMVPLLGNLFDIGWRANRRNYHLQRTARGESAAAGPQPFMAGSVRRECGDAGRSALRACRRSEGSSQVSLVGAPSNSDSYVVDGISISTSSGGVTFIPPWKLCRTRRHAECGADGVRQRDRIVSVSRASCGAARVDASQASARRCWMRVAGRCGGETHGRRQVGWRCVTYE